MKLFAASISPYTRKVRVVLAEKKIDCELDIVDVVPIENPVNEHNPIGKIPTLVLDDGTALYDSRVIVEFLASVSPIRRLIPDGTRDRVAVRRWEALADGVLDAGILIRYESNRDKNEQSRSWIAKQLARVHRGMKSMNDDLAERTWCHADRYSLADIAVGCCFGYLQFRSPGGVDWRAEYPNVARHHDKLMERPAFADTVPVAKATA